MSVRRRFRPQIIRQRFDPIRHLSVFAFMRFYRFADRRHLNLRLHMFGIEFPEIGKVADTGDYDFNYQNQKNLARKLHLPFATAEKEKRARESVRQF